MSDPVADIDAWLRDFVIGLELCPFARAPYLQGGVHIVASTGDTADTALADTARELAALAEHTEEERSTTLVVLPAFAGDWSAFRAVVGGVEALITASGSAQYFQVVGFHPQAVYEGADPEDPANAAARAPHPVVHLLRADAVARAIRSHPDAAGISERNAATLRSRARSAGD